MGHGGRGLNIPLRRELDIEERVALTMKSSVRLQGKQGARDNMVNMSHCFFANNILFAIGCIRGLEQNLSLVSRLVPIVF